MKENSNYKKFFYSGWPKRRCSFNRQNKIKEKKGIDRYEK